MTSYPAWTPASRPGIIPLRPLGFGTILGRSFAALRQNPKVLLGFALCVQAVAYLLVLGGGSAVAIAAFTRLDTLQPGTDEFDQVMAGSIAISAIAAFILTLAAGALSVLVQGVVLSEVAHAAVAEKLPLSALWQRRVKPVIGRMIGYALLVMLAVVLVLAAVTAGVVAVAVLALPIAIMLTVLIVLSAIPLSLWLSTKLLLVPAAIIMEHTSIRDGLVRSWTLIRGRFWPALGIIVVISLIMGTISQVVSVPFSFVTSGLTTIFAPTGDFDSSTFIGILIGAGVVEVIVLLIQSVAVVVQSTATALIYIDCRMRREGLDLDLQTYVERRDAGVPNLPDPYAVHPGRALPPRPPAPAYAGYAPPPGYPPQPAPAAPVLPPSYAGYPPPAAPAPAAPSATTWTAPGAPPAPDPRAPRSAEQPPS